jgi:hypothetical protein
MKISQRAATMNGKFESTSNDYDESNLNRLYSFLAARAVEHLLAALDLAGIAVVKKVLDRHSTEGVPRAATEIDFLLWVIN